MRTGQFGNYITDLLFPPRCPVCGGIAAKGQVICPPCNEKLPRIRGSRCAKCSKPVEEGAVLCDDCKEKDHAYTRGFAAFLYDDLMRRIISDCKYLGRREYCRALGVLLFEEAYPQVREFAPDVIVPVPLHPDRLRRRTYNQAEEIAVPFAKKSGIPLMPGLLRRNKVTDAMKKLDERERGRNLKGAFTAREGVRIPGRVLLVDDIYTTGSTADAAACALMDGGAIEVYFLAVCIGMGFMVRY